MIVETCPLLDKLPWVKHGFFGADNPHALTKGLTGHQHFNNDFPDTLFLKQTHSDRILQHENQVAEEADAILIDKPDLALAIKTADCCPILIACTATRQIAAIHAGWRGAFNRITEKTIAIMLSKGAQSSTLIAAIGPNIHVENYPVQGDVLARFEADYPKALEFFIPFEDRWKLNVAGIVADQIKQFGITNIWLSSTNTYNNPHFSSYRRYIVDPHLPDKRNISIIMLKP